MAQENAPAKPPPLSESPSDGGHVGAGITAGDAAGLLVIGWRVRIGTGLEGTGADVAGDGTGMTGMGTGFI